MSRLGWCFKVVPGIPGLVGSSGTLEHLLLFLSAGSVTAQFLLGCFALMVLFLCSITWQIFNRTVQ